MELFANRKFSNKENSNPVLVPSQMEKLCKEGLFNKNQLRYYPRRVKIQQQTQGSLGVSSSSKSLQKEIEKVAHLLKPLQQPAIPPEPLQEIFNDSLLRIHQMKPSTPGKRVKTPPIHNLPPLEDNTNTGKRQRTLSKKFALPPDLKRSKRTYSQLITNQGVILKRHNSIVTEADNSVKMLDMCPDVKLLLSDEEFNDLVKSDGFQLEFMILLQANSCKQNVQFADKIIDKPLTGTQQQQNLNNNISHQPVMTPQKVKEFILEQARKRKDMLEAEKRHLNLRQSFGQSLHQYIEELKSKCQF
ncbi:hypothetical protein pb186bvf_000014 [Paramecium bursaria]